MVKGNIQKEKIKEIVGKHLDFYNVSEEGRRGYSCHIERFYRTLQYLGETEFTGKVLEVGSFDVISSVIRAYYPENEYVNTEGELRETLPYKDGEFDFILNLEVLEHIGEQDYFKKEAFGFTGARTLLKECFRVLKPGGSMLLTTPNNSSFLALRQIINEEPPWLYFKHYKEYTLKQVESFLREAGFKIDSIKAEYVFTNKKEFSLLETFIDSLGEDTIDRGDTTFVRAIK